MSNPTSTRAYTIPGFRIELVREPGVKLAERPQLRDCTGAAPILAQYIGESDREVFVVALLTVLAGHARRDVNLWETLLLAAGLALFCVGLFVYALSQPFPAWWGR